MAKEGQEDNNIDSKLLQIVPEKEELPNLDSLGGSGDLSDINIDGDVGLVDHSVEPDATSLGVLSEIYPDIEFEEAAVPSNAVPQKVLNARDSLKKKVFFYNSIMEEMGFRRLGKWAYTNGTIDVLFSKDDKEKPRVFLFSGYNLTNIVPDNHKMRDIQIVREGSPMTAYQFFDQLAVKYFTIEGRLGYGIAPNNVKSEVAFGYSVPFNPEAHSGLKVKIEKAINDGKEVYVKIKTDIEEKLGNKKTISEITGNEAFRIYTWAYKQYTISKKPRAGDSLILECEPELVGGAVENPQTPEKPQKKSGLQWPKFFKLPTYKKKPKPKQ